MDLPTYRYKMTANVVVIVDGICYEARQIYPKLQQFFSDPMVVKTNQPIYKGDLLNESCLLDYSGLISQFVKQYLFNEPEPEEATLYDENEDEYKTTLNIQVCRVDDIRLEYTTSEDEFHGIVGGTVFASLLPSDTYNTLLSLEAAPRTSINREMRHGLYYQASERDSIDFWKERIPDWTEKFTRIGLADDLIG